MRFAVLAAVIINGAVYSYIAIMKYMAMNASVYDLGVSSQLLYSVFHESLGYNLMHITFNKLVYLPLSVIYLIYPHPQTVLVLQAFVVSAGAYPLYLIGKLKTGDSKTAFMIALTYLLFYPLYGPLWFDFHFMALFPTPFLFSFYFYLKGDARKSVLFAVIASITDLLAPVIMGLFGLYAFLKDRRNNSEKMFNFHGTGFLIVISSIIIFTAANIYIGPGYAVSFANNSVFSSTFAFTHTSKAYEATYFFWIMLPVLFICLLAPDLLFLIIPFAALAFANSYFPYVDTMFYQYTALVSAQIFVAFIFGIERLGRKLGKRGISAKRVAAAVLVLNIFLALLFTPAGNIATSNFHDQTINYDLTGNQNSYGTMNAITYHPYDSGILNMSHFITSGSSVVIQNNMPQLTSGYNWLLPDFLPLVKNPKFAITDPYSPAFYSAYFTLNMNHTMINETNRIFLPDHYGIVAEDYGEILLEQGYTGNVKEFIPLIYHGSSSFNRVFNSTLDENISLVAFNEPFLAPGQYEINFTGFNGNFNNTVFSGSYNNFNGTTGFYSGIINISSAGNAVISISVPFYMMNVNFSLAYMGNANSSVEMNLLQTGSR